jgi:hypothetical protein
MNLFIHVDTHFAMYFYMLVFHTFMSSELDYFKISYPFMFDNLKVPYYARFSYRSKFPLQFVGHEFVTWNPSTSPATITARESVFANQTIATKLQSAAGDGGMSSEFETNLAKVDYIS